MDKFNLGDLISLIIVFSIYLFAASGKTKKGKKGAENRRFPMRTRAQGEQMDRRAEARDRQTHKGFHEVFEDKMPGSPDLCDERPIHLHDVSQRQFADAAEGEDPCHVGGTMIQDDQMFDLPKDPEQDAFVQDVLRGVIMSEILTRPQDRAAIRRGRR